MNDADDEKRVFVAIASYNKKNLKNNNKEMHKWFCLLFFIRRDPGDDFSFFF